MKTDQRHPPMPGHDLELAPRPGLTPEAEATLEKLARETDLGDAPDFGVGS